MMKASFIITVCVTYLATLIYAFTRPFRTIPFTLDSNIFQWDPLLQSEFDVYDQLCANSSIEICNQSYESKDKFHQLLKQAFDNFILDRFSIFHQNYVNAVTQGSNFNWLSNSDKLTQASYLESMLETQAVQLGFLRGRTRCNNKTQINEPNICLYYKTLHDLQLLSVSISPQNLRTRVIDNLSGLTQISENLFNQMWYDHSEALSVYLYFHIVPYFEALVPDDREFTELILMTKVRTLVIMSESERLRGNLEGSTAMSLKIIQLIKQLSTQFELDERRKFIHELRILFAIPSIPPPFNVSLYYRREMIEDIESYRNNLNTVTIPLDYLAADVSATPFYMAHQGLNDKDFQIEMKNILTRLCPDLHYFAPFLLNEGIVNNPDRRTLKIGFISSHFTDHSIGRMLVEMITFMADQLTIDFSDSPSNRPDVLVYFLDGQFSQETQLTSAHDHITGTFEKFLGNRFIRLPLYNISYIQDRIAADQLDVLVFSDLGMDLSTYLLAFSRLAIYQVAWWGHPITSGLETIDYFFSIEDETSLPTSFAPTDVQYTEQLVRMDYVNSIPLLEGQFNEADRIRIFQELELPNDAKIAVVLGRLFKFHPSFEDLLIKLLIRIYESPESVRNSTYILCFAERLNDHNRIIFNRIEESLRNKYPQYPDHAIRTILSKFRVIQYLRYYHNLSPHARIALDSYPYGGCVTTHDALYYGLPSISLPSDYIRGRFTLAMYRQMNVVDFIAQNEDDYIEKAFSMLTDDSYFLVSKNHISEAFKTNLKRNKEVAMEWLGFFARLFD